MLSSFDFSPFHVIFVIGFRVVVVIVIIISIIFLDEGNFMFTYDY